MRESTVEAHLKSEVAKAGGTTRKWVSPGRNNVPDQIVIWPRVRTKKKKGYVVKYYVAEIHFVETKAPKKDARPGQKREHKRLRDMGCTVLVIDTKDGVDEYVGANK